MKLIGKCKEDFLTWICKNHSDVKWCDYQTIKEIYLNALIIDFFDSVGIYISIESFYDALLCYHRGFESIIYNKAIKHANKLYNENH